MTPLAIIIYLLVGTVAGLVAWRGVRNPHVGIPMNIAVGIFGAFVGGWIFGMLAAVRAGVLGAGLVGALGAAAVLALFHLTTRRRVR